MLKNENKPLLEKKHRLPLNLYKGQSRITFTLCIEKRSKVFVKKEVIDKCLEILQETIDKYDCKNWAYIFMPDHLHVVIEGNSKKSDLWKSIVLFKQKTGFWFSRNSAGIRWQKDFYDHIHRKDEDLVKHIRYILDNSFRKGLCSDWKEYPFRGSLSFSLDDII